LTRDRDPAGRPRNARPRDALGRPLDRSEPEVGPPPIPDDLVITGPDAARLADELLREGRPFHAHEVLEAAWKSAPARERDLWQGLAQIAVGLTHARRGNARGAVALLRRGALRVRAQQDQPDAPAGHERDLPTNGPDLPGHDRDLPGHDRDLPGHDRDLPYGMDIPAVLAASDDLAARIERDGLDNLAPADLALRLVLDAGSVAD
jgi:hypothetical protein